MLRRYHQLLELLEPKVRRCIAIDETKLKVKGSIAYVWAAIDVDNNE